MNPVRMIAAATALFVALVALAACSGDDDPQKIVDEVLGTSTPSSSSTGTPPSADNTASSGSGSQGGERGSENDFRDAAGKFPGSKYRGTYRVTGGEMQGTFVIIKDGEDRIRYEIESTQDGETVSGTFIQNGDQSGFCLQDPGEFAEVLGVPAGEGVCFNDDQAIGSVGSLTEEFDNLQEGNYEVANATKRQIAGQDAQCADVTTTDGDTSNSCFSDDGELLYVSDPSDNSVFEATEISGNVEGDAFDFPYPVRELPNVPTQ